MLTILKLRLTVEMISLQVTSQLDLPLVAIGQELLLVVQQLLVCLCRVFVVGALNNSVDGTSLLTETAVNALGHVNIVTRSAARSILAGLSLNSNSLGRANGFAKLAGNATLLS